MKTISGKLISILLFSTVIILTINASIGFYYEKSRMDKEINEDVDRVENRLALILPNVLWDLNYELAQKIINIELLDKNIVEIEIFDTKGNIIGTAGDVQRNKNNSTKIFPITVNKEEIASVNIVHSHKTVNALTKNKIYELIFSWLFVIIGLYITFKIAMEKFVIKHLRDLENGIKEFAQGKKRDIFIDTEDELHYLAVEFNKMKRKIAQEVKNSQKKDEILSQQSKMATIGDMISNIAHQWRQPLNSLSLILQSVTMKLDLLEAKDENLNKNLTKADELIIQMSKTIDDFRDFYKPNKSKKLLASQRR